MKRMLMVHSLRLFCITLTLSTLAYSAENVVPVDFARDVYPILRRSCIECHGEKLQEGELRLDRRDQVIGVSIIDTKEPLASELLRRIELPKGHAEVMPAIGEPLTAQQILIIKRWIQQGAKWPVSMEIPKHWAYVPPQRPVIPKNLNSDQTRNPIDRFVQDRLQQVGLRSASAARPEKLLRRTFLDLIGLPPTVQEVEAFIADSSPQHYERIVDKLLQRPQFGERWGRHWLDLARYADSHGFQRDNLRDHWAYRDWVIQALNSDMPFDQFSIDQLAGDLLPDATIENKIATGFHRCTPTNVEAGSLPEETRVEQVIDRVNTTGAVWLGSTLECCQCHDHKYDPFSTKEYYQLLAFFNNTQPEADRANPESASSIAFNGPYLDVPNPMKDQKRQQLQQQLDTTVQQIAARRKELVADLETWATALHASSQSAPQTHLLTITSFESTGSTDSHQVLKDGSVLLTGGDPPEKDVYKVRVKTNVSGIRAFRLDCLQDDVLPGKGPGRGDPARRNFVLNDFSVFISDETQENAPQTPATQKLHFTKASASFSQTKWDVGGAIDDQDKTGWAISPQFDSGHWAIFELADPIDLNENQFVEVQLSQQFGSSRTIGRFTLSVLTGNIGHDAVSSDVLAIVSKPVTEWSKEDRNTLVNLRVTQDSDSLKLSTEKKTLDAELAKVAADTTLVMVEMNQPRTTAVYERGDYRNLGELVEPGTPAVLHAIPTGARNRLDLAKWLVSKENPLVARVTVNRLWAELFGHGIVTTPEDFGLKGELPTHPELLDWLAVEFMEHHWSLKHVLKSIVMSATYQQSSHVSQKMLEIDDKNLLLARGPRFRMDAEMIRDNALSISGLIDLTQFGPPIYPEQPAGLWSKVGGTNYQYEVSPGSEQYRRGIYVILKRGSPYPSFVNFDANSRFTCTIKRSRTNTPLQALTLLNDPVYVDSAKSLAKRIQAEYAGKTLDEQLRYAFQLCTARGPNQSELTALRKLYDDQHRTLSAEDAWVSVASVLLNLHETITKD